MNYTLNKTRCAKQISLIAILGAGLTASTLSSQAATVIWETPVDITSVNDINIAGTLVSAGSWGTTGAQDVTVGTETITFAEMAAADLSPAAWGVQSNAGLYGGDTGDATFNAVLDSNAWAGGTDATRTFTLSGLAVDQEYQVQFFVSDDRDETSRARTVTFSAGNTSDSLSYTGQYVIGSFTTDAVTQSQSITISPSAGEQFALNAYVLRAIPEPSSYAALLGLGALALVSCRRK